MHTHTHTLVCVCIYMWIWTHDQYVYTSVGQPEKTYIHHLCADTGCCLDDLTKVMVTRDIWWKRLKENMLLNDDVWMCK